MVVVPVGVVPVVVGVVVVGVVVVGVVVVDVEVEVVGFGALTITGGTGPVVGSIAYGAGGQLPRHTRSVVPSLA